MKGDKHFSNKSKIDRKSQNFIDLASKINKEQKIETTKNGFCSNNTLSKSVLSITFFPKTKRFFTSWYIYISFNIILFLTWICIRLFSSNWNSLGIYSVDRWVGIVKLFSFVIDSFFVYLSKKKMFQVVIYTKHHEFILP